MPMTLADQMAEIEEITNEALIAAAVTKLQSQQTVSVA
jgi:hypothetical protein